MSTSICCAALAAAPSARGGDRSLPGRRAALGAAGFRGVGFPLSMAPPKRRGFTMACAKATNCTYSGSNGDEAEFDMFYGALSKQTEAMVGHFIFFPVALSEEEKAVQKNLKEIAERCMDLQAGAMRRLRPEQRRPLYPLFRTVHLAFAFVKARAMEGHANSGESSLLLVEKLDVVRKMVSSACSAPLPLEPDKVCCLPPLVEEAIGGLGVKSNSAEHVVAFSLIEYTFNTVKSDIDNMITASATCST